MENAAEALKMAAWILIFVVALSFSINAITILKQNIDSIVADTDREYNTKYVEGNRKDTNSDGIIDERDGFVTERIIGYESIVPTIYKAYKERFKVVFDGSTGIKLYKDLDTGEEVSTLDISVLGTADDATKEYFIKRIMLGNDSSFVDPDYESQHFSKYKFLDSGLYNQIKGKQYSESLGEFYPADLDGSDTTEANKVKKRVITYSSL